MFDPENPPELQVSAWLNVKTPPTLKGLKGKVVVVTPFQLHCPGSIKHGLPQAARLAASFNDDEVVVIGLNTPFEDPAKQDKAAVEAFVAEHEFTFPIALDKPGAKGELPKTMEDYEIRGTPTILLFDRQGRLRRHYLQYRPIAAPAPPLTGARVEFLLVPALPEPEHQRGRGRNWQARKQGACCDPRCRRRNLVFGACLGGPQ